MKNTLTFAFSVLLTSTYGQGTQKRATKQFEKFAYETAAKRYEKAEAEELSLEEKRNLAYSYRQTNEWEKAEDLYSEILSSSESKPTDVYNYASILRENEKYAKSEKWMKRFSEMNVRDTRGKAYANKPDAYKSLLKNKGQFEINKLSISGDHQEFGVSYYTSDKVVFVSSDESTKPIFRRYNQTKLPFLNLYTADVKDNELSKSKLLSKKIGARFHVGPVAFNKECDMMIFTGNGKKKSEDGTFNLKLYLSHLESGKWEKPVELPFNSDQYSCGHATISSDGKWIYFASDMPGGMGGSDIYKASYNKGDGSFGEPINAGEKINSEGNELFPFIHQKGGLLFFSSDGKVGLGGLDVFVAELKSDYSIGSVVNPGAPLNSNRDDFSFVANEEVKHGYLSSTRGDGMGSDDIYGVQILKPFRFGKTLKGLSTNKEGEPIPEVAIKLLNAEGEVMDSSISNIDGQFVFAIDKDGEYTVVGQKEKYFDGKTALNTLENPDVSTLKAAVVLEKDPDISLYVLITDKKEGKPLDGVRIKLTDNMTGKTEEVTTPATGDYTKALAGKKLQDRGSYNIEFSKKGYGAKSVTYNVLFDKEGQYKVADEQDMTLEKVDVGVDIGKMLALKPIYFDSGKYKIKPDAAVELDKIVKFMNENTSAIIELGSHTDSKGSSQSNRRLSDRRAKSSADYIKERIKDPSRIYGKGYGEEKLINECGNGVNCPPEKHAENRRTEFILIKM